MIFNDTSLYNYPLYVILRKEQKKDKPNSFDVNNPLKHFEM